MACWGTCSAHARLSWGPGVLQRASHDGGEVAAGGQFCAAWQSGEGTARGVEGGGELQRDAWMPAQAGGGQGGSPERQAALRRGAWK